MKRGIGVALAVALIAGVFAAWYLYPRAGPDRAGPDRRGQTLMIGSEVERRDIAAKDLDDLFTKEGTAVVKGADRIEFFKQEIHWESSSDWKIIQQRTGTAEQLSKAREALLSPQIYSWGRRGGHKKCGGFSPRDVVRFWRGNESVTFLICFTCMDIGVIYQDQAGRGRSWIIADFQPGKQQLKEVMERVFPGTVEIHE